MSGCHSLCLEYKEVSITSKVGTQLEVVEDFKYLGSWMSSTEADIKNSKGMAWKACNKLDKIWKSGLSKDLKMRLLTSIVESVLLYGCEAWSLSKKQGKGLDGCYTRILRKALNISWKDHVTVCWVIHLKFLAFFQKTNGNFRSIPIYFLQHYLMCASNENF